MDNLGTKTLLGSHYKALVHMDLLDKNRAYYLCSMVVDCEFCCTYSKPVRVCKISMGFVCLYDEVGAIGSFRSLDGEN